MLLYVAYLTRAKVNLAHGTGLDVKYVFTFSADRTYLVRSRLC